MVGKYNARNWPPLDRILDLKTSLWCPSPFYVPIDKSGACRSDCSSDSKTNPSILLAQLVGDVNLAVAVEAVQAIGNLASGLRKDFTAGARLLLPVLLVSFHPRSLNWTTLLIVFLLMPKFSCFHLVWQ